MKTGEAVSRYGGRFSAKQIRRWADRGWIAGATRAPDGWWDLPADSLDAFVERRTPQVTRRKRAERDRRAALGS